MFTVRSVIQNAQLPFVDKNHNYSTLFILVHKLTPLL